MNDGSGIEKLDIDKLDWRGSREFFESLGEALDRLDDKDEAYDFTWVGKRKAIIEAGAPINKTFRPNIEASKNWDTTENLFIEGDNLDALKLLQESYLGKVKMIYIDPPYNTGKDFVYRDAFQKSNREQDEESGNVDENTGARLVKNEKSNGRYHSDWLSMMYPRLKLARNLMSEDGVIYISIDDNEQSNIKKICDEVFGEDNFISQLIWRKSKGSGNDSKYLMVEHEYILLYSRNLELLKFNNSLSDDYEVTRGKYNLGKLDRGSKGYVSSLDYGIKAPDGSLVYPNGRTEQKNDGWRWMWSKKKLDWGLDNGFVVVQKGANDKWQVYVKSYAYVDNEDKPIIRTRLFKSHLGFDEQILNISANAEIKSLFDGNTYFSYPKPTKLIKALTNMVTSNEDIILDFFSGSGTTADAVMQLNAEDGANRKWIMVQLPEETYE